MFSSNNFIDSNQHVKTTAAITLYVQRIEKSVCTPVRACNWKEMTLKLKTPNTLPEFVGNIHENERGHLSDLLGKKRDHRLDTSFLLDCLRHWKQVCFTGYQFSINFLWLLWNNCLWHLFNFCTRNLCIWKKRALCKNIQKFLAFQSKWSSGILRGKEVFLACAQKTTFSSSMQIDF